MQMRMQNVNLDLVSWFLSLCRGVACAYAWCLLRVLVPVSVCNTRTGNRVPREEA